MCRVATEGGADLVRYLQYKLLALDVDGTLMNSQKRISQATRLALSQAMAQGVHVTLATGRGFPSAVAIARSLGLKTPLVTHDGGYVADPVTGRVVSRVAIPAETTAKAVELFRECGLHVALLHEKFRVIDDRLPYWRKDWFKPGRWGEIYNFLWEYRNYPLVHAPNLAEYVRSNQLEVPKYYVTGDATSIKLGQTRLQQEMGDLLRTASAGPEAMEVMPVGLSKGTGVEALAKSLGLTMQEVIACGDNYNDVEMIRAAGMGVAMGQAPDEVRWSARFVTRSNDEDGVAYVVKRFLLDEAA
ncbi:MAG: Cof-type HAD-IIB family hydrolase [Mycobacterium leprae]